MMPTLSRMSLDLSREQGVRLVNALGTRIECRSGALWITVDNDPRDVLLDAGESFTLDTNQGTIVQAILGAAEVAIAQDHPCEPVRIKPVHEVGWRLALRALLPWRTAGAR